TELDNDNMLHTGDSVEAEIQLASVYNTKAGRKMCFVAKFYCGSTQVATVYTDALVRKNPVLPHQQFRNTTKRVYRCTYTSVDDVAVLNSKPWFVCKDPAKHQVVPGMVLEFELESSYRYRTDVMYSHVASTGPVYLVQPNNKRLLIAHVDYENADVAGSSVVEYLEKNSVSLSESCMFDTGGYSITAPEGDLGMSVTAPTDNWVYARASGDYNTIHTNPHIADYAGLPDMIVHGMWTSASTRALVEKYVADGIPERVRSFETEFTWMVLPGDRLETKLKHIGMKQGRMLIQGVT
ncbi:fatty acid synthase alpha subunit Lsd1, partial [Linderina pennispora]